MKLSLSTGLTAGILALSIAATPALAAPTVTVRVEGAGGTLLERTTVTLSSEGVAGTSCTGDTAGAAIEAATRGNWDRQEFVSTILGETHAYPNPDYWAEWIDRGTGYKRGAGICNDHLVDGNEVLMLVDSAIPPTYAPMVFPLDIEGAPASATAGSDVAVTVVEYRSTTGDIGEGDRTPVAGATITGGAAPVTTGADGKATVRLAQVGTAVLKATKAGDAPSAGERVTVLAAGTQPVTAAPLTPAAPDKTAPRGKLTGFKDHQVFTSGPRDLRGSFTDTSGVRVVKLRLTKRVGKKCWYFSGKQERFRGSRCGRGAYFAIGDKADWSYLLPAQLGPGRYVLDAVAIDGAGNRTPLQRGSTRVVFSVR
jgi:hypothetical protein